MGASGRDTLIGGGGRDVFLGGAGSDTLLARDGARDTGSGGTGLDRARVDKSDVLKSVEKRF
jgi:Ca2+-binding RTX toxin-like protein